MTTGPDVACSIDNSSEVRAPHGAALSCRSWQTEAPMRMLTNNMDAEVAEKPQELVVYGGIGRAVLNALLNTASGATWASLHHGGGVGIGYSQHAGMVIVCHGSEESARRIERVLWNDPASGVMRHADAGYDDAIACARQHRLNLPFLDG